MLSGFIILHVVILCSLLYLKCHRDFEDVHNDTPRKAYKEVPPQKRFEPINFDPRCVNFDFFHSSYIEDVLCMCTSLSS